MAEASQTKEKSKYSPNIYKESVNTRGVITPAAAIPDKYLPGVSGVGTASGTGGNQDSNKLDFNDESYNGLFSSIDSQRDLRFMPLPNDWIKDVDDSKTESYFGQALDRYKEEMPFQNPSSIEEYNANSDFIFAKTIELEIDDLENTEYTTLNGVQGVGFTLRGAAGASGSISIYRVFDQYGNKGTVISTNGGGLCGAPQASATIDYLDGRNLDSIYQLEGGSITNGASGTFGLINVGGEVVKPFSDGEEIPAYKIYSAGLATPSAVPPEYHF